MKKTNIERKNQTRSVLRGFAAAAVAAVSVLGFACQPNQTVLKDVAPPTPSPMETVEMQKTSFDQDLREMQTADFDYILVFRRKDGGVFDKEDQRYLRDNTPIETNRWRRSDDGRAFIAGSGFGFLPEQLAALRARFNVEDYSKPEIKANANKAVNAPAGSGNFNVTVKADSNK